MRLILLLSCIAALAGAGCSNLPRSLEPESLFPAPGEDIDVTSVSPGKNGAVCTQDPVLTKDGKIPAETTQFAVVTFCAYKATSTADTSYWMPRFVDKGVALSDQTCSRFFNQLEARRVESSYAQANTNIVGTAVTAVLAATETHARSVFNVATLLTVSNGWFENYKVNYLLTPELGKLHSVIQDRLRAPIAASMREKSAAGGYRSYDDAKKDVMSYDQLCSHKVLQNVVTESIAKAEILPFVSGPSSEKVARANDLKQDLFQTASGGTAGAFSAGEFEALYVVATTTGDSAKRIAAAKALTELDAKYSAYVSKLGLDQANPPAGVVTKFQLAGELLALDTLADIRTLRAKIAEKVTAAAGSPGAAAPPVPNPVLDKAQSESFKALAKSIPSASTSAQINFGYEVRGGRR